MNVTLEVWSGGQTGCDQAGLDAAIACGLSHKGWIPKGRKNEDGQIPAEYSGLTECDTDSYPARTKKNVQDTDGTLLFVTEKLSRGTELTRNTANRLRRPLLVVPVKKPPSPETFRTWLSSNGISKLNIAGPRESKNPGIHDAAYKILLRYFGRPD